MNAYFDALTLNPPHPTPGNFWDAAKVDSVIPMRANANEDDVEACLLFAWSWFNRDSEPGFKEIEQLLDAWTANVGSDKVGYYRGQVLKARFIRLLALLHSQTDYSELITQLQYIALSPTHIPRFA